MVKVAKYSIKYIITILIAIDQLFNTLLLGDPDETLSSRSYRCKSNPLWNLVHSVIDLIFFFDKVYTSDEYIVRHCELSFLMYVRRRQSTVMKYEDDVKHLIKEIKHFTPHF